MDWYRSAAQARSDSGDVQLRDVMNKILHIHLVRIIVAGGCEIIEAAREV